MSTNPDYPDYRLTDRELASLIKALFQGDVLVPATPTDDTPDRAKIVTAYAIVRAESGGQVNAFRSADDNPNGGDDRGIWQINSKWHPDIDDADAYHPYVATQRAVAISSQGNDWTPWSAFNNDRLNLDAARNVFDRLDGDDEGYLDSEEIRARMVEIAGGLVSPTVISKTPFDGAFSSLLQIGAVLTNPDWWRRIGIAALGVGLLIVALVLTNGPAAVKTVAGLTPAGKLTS